MRFTEDHIWLEQDDDDIVIGLTEYGMGLFGKLIFIDLPESGDVVTRDEALFVVEGEEATTEFLSPIDATIIDVNPAADGGLEAIAEDPMDHGWLLRLEAGEGARLDDFLTEAAYSKLIV